MTMIVVCVYPKIRRGTTFKTDSLHAEPTDVVDKFPIYENGKEYVIYNNKKYQTKSRVIQGISEKYIIIDKNMGYKDGRKFKPKKWCS